MSESSEQNSDAFFSEILKLVEWLWDPSIQFYSQIHFTYTRKSILPFIELFYKFLNNWINTKL